MPTSIEIPINNSALKLRDTATGKEVWDNIRKQWVVLTPEEFVRQQIILFLTEHKDYPTALIAVEKGIKLNGTQKRCDIIIYNHDGKAVMIIECKAPEVNISQDTFDQVARYNLTLQVPYLFVSNGHSGYCCKVDLESGGIVYLEEVPGFGAL